MEDNYKKRLGRQGEELAALFLQRGFRARGACRQHRAQDTGAQGARSCAKDTFHKKPSSYEEVAVPVRKEAAEAVDRKNGNSSWTKSSLQG